MTKEVETAVVELEIVSCQTCDLLFVASERRQTCPVCGGEGTGPYLEYVLDETGLHQKVRGTQDELTASPAEEPAEAVESSEEPAEAVESPEEPAEAAAEPAGGLDSPSLSG